MGSEGLPVTDPPGAHVSSSCSQGTLTKSTFLLLSATSVTSASASDFRSMLTIPEPSVSCSPQSSADGRSRNVQKHRALRDLPWLRIHSSGQQWRLYRSLSRLLVPQVSWSLTFQGRVSVSHVASKQRPKSQLHHANTGR